MAVCCVAFMAQWGPALPAEPPIVLQASQLYGSLGREMEMSKASLGKQ